MKVLYTPNDEARRLLEIVLDAHKVLIIEPQDKNRSFLEKMCQDGYLVNMETYYHINSKLKKKLLEILKEK